MSQSEILATWCPCCFGQGRLARLHSLAGTAEYFAGDRWHDAKEFRCAQCGEIFHRTNWRDTIAFCLCLGVLLTFCAGIPVALAGLFWPR